MTLTPRFQGKGQPVEKSKSAGEYVFTVSDAGHYSVELFGQEDSGLRNALLIFLDHDTEPACPQPSGGGKLYRYTGPNVPNAANPSWANTGYYAFDTLTLGAGDVVCVERG